MAGVDHSCPAPSDSTGSSSLPEKGQDDRTTQLSISKLSSTHMAGAHHSCPAPSDSTSSSSLVEKGQDDRVSELAQ
ncbi:hypothetical protein Taro_053462 [Colocasia esculenta]|uniref:Uncharacterized protein n=1 Tax=Colocasia esculenta TaxID=4460 RepID=A0A843XMN9_COLES|nr:hypothetical protein [Colocasia esculenta]